jgi:hypothetical protein
MESQEQCDRMKQICIDNGLPIWNDIDGWNINISNTFCYSNSCSYNGDFALYSLLFGKSQATETEFLQLLKEYNDGK